MRPGRPLASLRLTEHYGYLALMHGVGLITRVRDSMHHSGVASAIVADDRCIIEKGALIPWLSVSRRTNERQN